MLNEQLAEVSVRHAVYLERLKASEVAGFRDFLQAMDRSLRERLASGDLTEFSRTRLERLLAATRADLREILTRYRQQLGASLADLAEYEAGFQARALEGVGFEPIIPSADQVRAAIFTQPLSVKGAQGGMLLEPFLQHFSDTEVSRLSGAIRQGYYEGLTTRQVVQRIRGTRARRYKDGILEITSRNANAVARTAIQHAASTARQQTWMENGDIVTGYRWLSTLDGRTSTLCRSLDGRVYKIGKGPLPPAHVNCRSATTPELDGRFAFLDEGGTRAARDPETGKIKRVSADESYYGWLKRQSAEFQNDVIGPARGKLLRDGGLSAQRFADLQLDRNFTPLTLEEMRSREPLAFRRAEL